jgi:hypothetical protein
MDAKELWRNYNLAPEEIEKLHTYQKGLCLVCRRPLVLGSPSVCIDHRHKDGLVRGLLCFLCNRGLGLLGDDISRLYNALAYLQDPPAVHALKEHRFGCVGRGPLPKTRSRRPGFYGRFVFVAAQLFRGIFYKCGCVEYSAKPLKLCPVHKQPQNAEQGACATQDGVR